MNPFNQGDYTWQVEQKLSRLAELIKNLVKRFEETKDPYKEQKCPTCFKRIIDDFPNRGHLETCPLYELIKFCEYLE